MSTARETNIAVSRTFYTKLSVPYSDCISGSNSLFYKLLVQQNGVYRFRDCIQYCYQQHLIQTCGCSDALSPSYNSSVRECLTLKDMLTCVYIFYATFYTGSIEEKCPYCKYECEWSSYETSTSLNSYPSPNYGKFLMRLNKIKATNITTYEKLKRNVLSVNIFYDQLKYTVVEDVPSTDLLTLISGIGGTMGLFLGMSFISFLEIAEVFIEILFLSEILEKIRKL